jgi:8-oxo-dGTP diphosphatase
MEQWFCGWVSRSPTFVCPYANNVFLREGKHYLTVFMTAEGLVGKPRVMEPDKCSAWRWFNYSDLPNPLFAPFETILAAGWRFPQCDQSK